MAFLTAQKKNETIARMKVKSSMEEEINEEKLAELLGRIMSEATAMLKDKFMNRTKQHALATRFSDEDENEFCAYEVYDTEASLEAHRNTVHSKRFRAAADDMMITHDMTRCWQID